MNEFVQLAYVDVPSLQKPAIAISSAWVVAPDVEIDGLAVLPGAVVPLALSGELSFAPAYSMSVSTPWHQLGSEMVKLVAPAWAGALA